MKPEEFLLAQAADPSPAATAAGAAAAASPAAEAAAAAAAAASPVAEATIAAAASPGADAASGGFLDALGHAAEAFIGVFNAGGATFVGFVTGILPTLIVLLTAVYAVIQLVGEQRVQGLARWAASTMITRYTLLPLLAVFFLTNPMAYTFGVFLEEKYKPAFYDSAVSFVHPITGLFPHANSGELFVWLGMAAGIQALEAAGTAPFSLGKLAIFYFIVGLIVILLKGIVTERITMILARREGIQL